MATKQQPEQQPTDNRKKSKKAKTWTPPRGIRYAFRDDRPRAPFWLHWRDEAGNRKAQGYEDAPARELAAKDLADKRTKHGDEVLTFDPLRWRKYLEFQKIVGEDIDPIIVAHEWIKAQQGTPKRVGKTVSDAIKDYTALRKDEKSWGPEATRHATKHLERFARVFGRKRVNEIGTDEVRVWLRDLKDEKGMALGPHSVKAHRKNVNTFFGYCVRERWGAIENPLASIKPPRTEDGDPVVIPLRDAWEFFKANCDARVIGRVALEAFAGVRYTTAGLIGTDGINFAGKGIRMKATIHKTGNVDGRTRYRQGHPDNLWEWLRHTPDETWTMKALGYREEKRHASVRSGLRPGSNQSAEDAEKIKGTRNVWRHSFISYHLAAFRNVPTTQYLAQHSNPKTTEEYEGMADHNHALRYFMITPETVKLTWEQFIAIPIAEPAAKKK